MVPVGKMPVVICYQQGETQSRCRCSQKVSERMSDKKLTITNTTARKARENKLIGNPHFPKLKREGSRGLLEILLHTKHPMQME